MTELLATTKNVLHPRQVVELKETKAQLEGMLNSAPYIRNQLQDGGAAVVKQIGGIDDMLSQAPEPIASDNIDSAVELEKQLRAEWLNGMPTQAEMRKNPSGAVDKNIAWDRRSKNTVLRWKHLRRRLHASGISEHRLADEGDVSNIEMYRPVGGAQEMNMDNPQIAGTEFHLPPPGADPAVVMSDEQADLLKSINPELHQRMALLDNEQRGEVLALVDRYAGMDKTEPEPRVVKAKTSYHNSELAQLRARAKELGINSYGKSKVALRHEIEQRG